MNVVPAAADDYDAFALLFRELAVPDPTPSRVYFEENVLPGMLVAKDGERVAGYVWARLRGESVHVVHAVVTPACRRRGVGKALLGAVAERARREGHTRWMLNVKPENVGAIALYESCGFARMHASVSMRLPWANLAKVEGTPDGVVARELAPGEDARFEGALGLSRGEIAGYRVLGRTPFGTADAEGPLAVGLLDPRFPGASPLRVREPRNARAVLEAMRPLVEAEHIFVFVEGAPALEATMEHAGATAVMRVLHMEGMIPPQG